MKLSICVITMNRASQLKDALKSCFECELPKETEFVVIDNASTDKTEEVVKGILENCGYTYYYEKLPENLGVGGGRNYAYEKASGEYVYMLDDDAVIDCENNPDFFMRAIEILDNHSLIVTLTTQIYDTAWKKNRCESRGPKLKDGLYKCQMFCGGSHFMRSTFFVEGPYLSNKYGYEELPPSLRVINRGKINAFCPQLRVIHKPAINKWDWGKEENHGLLIETIALSYAIKRMMYPRIFSLILNIAHKKRIKKYFGNIESVKDKARLIAENLKKDYPIKEKVSFFTVIRMFFDFGISVF